MPELPEVESAKRSLQRVIRGKVIASVEVRSPSAVRTHRPQAFADALAGKRIERVSRRGKTLLFQLSGGWALLTDQERIAGIGNLWAHEILNAARIRPDRPASSLTPAETRVLHRSIRSVLRRAIAAGGEPEFVDAAGRMGRWRLAVYGRAGQRCLRGDGTIKEARLGGRPSFYCPKCQR